MNRQPYGTPPRWWAPNLSSWWIRVSRGYRRRQMLRLQKIVSVECENFSVVKQAVADGAGVMITPNHSAHHDSAILYLAADQADQPLYFMAAWQVFAMSTAFQCWALRRMGCFSIDREGNDRQAFKQAIEILQSQPHPLVIFPEGDIYHTTDHVTPFREGAAAIALSAAKRSERPIVAFPCAIKFRYVEDPTENLLAVLDRVETRLLLRPEPTRPMTERIYRLAEAALALKEVDYLGQTAAGPLPDRIRRLSDTILSRLETIHGVANKGGSSPPERVKNLRQTLIKELEDDAAPPDEARWRELTRDLDDVFFAMQLYSYRGDYLMDNPSIERLAETIDKFEEDILGLDYPSVHGRRRVTIQFGEPIECKVGESRRDQIGDLTRTLQERVQQLLDKMNGR